MKKIDDELDQLSNGFHQLGSRLDEFDRFMSDLGSIIHDRSWDLGAVQYTKSGEAMMFKLSELITIYLTKGGEAAQHMSGKRFLAERSPTTLVDTILNLLSSINLLIAKYEIDVNTLFERMPEDDPYHTLNQLERAEMAIGHITGDGRLKEEVRRWEENRRDTRKDMREAPLPH